MVCNEGHDGFSYIPDDLKGFSLNERSQPTLCNGGWEGGKGVSF